MKRYLLSMLLFFSVVANAQIWEGIPNDSVNLHFSDSMHSYYLPDTATTPLWQIGKTVKPFFTPDTNGLNTIMTDTVNSYPVMANNWFTIKVKTVYPTITINFWHRFETDSAMDGGTVEFSFDSGVTWQNVKGECNPVGFGIAGVLTQNFYSNSDTLLNGVPVFTGKTNVTQLSRFQFSHGYLSPPLPPSCNFWDTVLIRFRFMSDSLADTFAGWIIDSIKIERDRYELNVDKADLEKILQPYPNPSYTGTFSFPPLKNEQLFTIEVYNTLGQKVLNTPYKHTLDISHLPKGLYFYKVTDGIEYYSGRLLYE